MIPPLLGRALFAGAAAGLALAVWLDRLIRRPAAGRVTVPSASPSLRMADGRDRPRSGSVTNIHTRGRMNGSRRS